MSTFKRQKGGKPPANSTTINVGYVPPSTVAAPQMGGGGFYSLNKRSNVPFVTLRGSSGYRKTISWGEIAEIPGDQMVTVQNSSYHGGDIFLNWGDDVCNRPSRITVPVSYEEAAEVSAGQFYWRAAFPCDVRGAKRAYLQMDAYLPNTAATAERSFTVRGRKVDGSMKTANQLSRLVSPFGPGVGYYDVHLYPIDTVITVPLGKNAPLGDDGRPHMLLDNADVFFFSLVGFTPYVWPAQEIPGFPPSSNTPFPSTWYVVEYD